jgi:hypothetical protein
VDVFGVGQVDKSWLEGCEDASWELYEQMSLMMTLRMRILAGIVETSFDSEVRKYYIVSLGKERDVFEAGPLLLLSDFCTFVAQHLRLKA